MSKIPEGTQFIEAGCGEKGFRKFEKGCWWFYEGFWRHVDWKMGALTLVTEHPDYTAPATPWSGEGLPPAGELVEWRYDGHAWKSAKIHYIGSIYVIVSASGGEQHYYLRDISFRPTRTAEQIAADERLHKVRNALTAINSKVRFPGDVARSNVMVATIEAMIDASYSKQVVP